MLNLFYSPNAVSRATFIMLHETSADYTQTLVDFSSGEQTESTYLQVNPLGRVPALQTDKGILTETPAILTYLAQRYPQHNLALSDDPWQAAQVQSFCGFLASTVHVNHAHGRRGSRWASQQSSFDDMFENLPRTMTASMQIVEDRINGPWVMGQHYTICDPYLFTFAGWLEADRVAVEQFPKISDHMARMKARPAVQAALKREAN